MKLTLPQKIAIVVCLIWITACLGDILGGNKGWEGMLISAILGPLAILWISGALKPLVNWFRGTEQ